MRRCLPMVVTAVWALAAVACGDGSGPEGVPINLDEGWGTLVSDPDERVMSRPAWSPDGQWAYYMAASTGGGYPVLCRAAAGGAGRTVLDLGGAVPAQLSAPGILGFLAPAAGGDVYVTANPDGTGPRGVLRWREDAPPEWLPGIDAPVAIGLAPGGMRLVYGTDSPPLYQLSLWSYEIASGVSTHLVAGGTPLAFSPDGTELLYVAEDGTHVAAALATGATRPVDLGLESDFPDAVRWDTDGLEVLFRRFDYDRVGYDYYLRDVGAGTSTRFYQERFDDVVLSDVEAWSPDGSRMALWFEACLEGAGLFSCDTFHSALYVIGVPEGSETWIAGARNAQARMAGFSPDGRRVSYVIRGGLYVSAVG